MTVRKDGKRMKYNHEIQFDLDHLSAYEHVSNLDEKKVEIDEVYSKAAKADEYEVKAKAFDHAREILTTKIEFLRNRADRVDDIEVENELRETLSKFEEVDHNLMKAFVKASFGKKTAAEKMSERKSNTSLKGKLRDMTVDALEKKMERSIETDAQKELKKYREEK